MCRNFEVLHLMTAKGTPKVTLWLVSTHDKVLTVYAQVMAAERAGAEAVLVFNSVPDGEPSGGLMEMGGDGGAELPGIPAVLVSQVRTGVSVLCGILFLSVRVKLRSARSALTQACLPILLLHDMFHKLIAIGP